MDSLSKYRKEAKMNQTELGEKLGVSKQLVSAWENGTARIDRKHAPGLKKIFSLSDEQLENVMNNVIEIIPAGEDSCLDQVIEAVMSSELDPVAKVKLYEIIQDVKKKRVRRVEIIEPKEKPEPLDQNHPRLPKGFKGRRLVSDPVENDTLTPRGKAHGGLLDIELRCPECGCLYHISRLKATKTHACPNCGKHIKLEN